MGPPVVNVSDLSRSFGGKSALEGVQTVICSSHLLEVERMSDHVTLMHQGRVVLSGVLDDVRRGYQRSRVRFVEHVGQSPVLDTALALDGGGRTWSVVHARLLEQFRHSVLARGSEVV